MRFILAATIGIILTACSTLGLRPDPQRPCHANDKPWPVSPEHFYDHEIHLVPYFADAPKGYRAPNFMTGYAIVFLKPGSVYEKMGLQNGDVLLAIDNLKFVEPVPPDTFQRLKEQKYEELTIDRCLQIKGKSK